MKDFNEIYQKTSEEVKAKLAKQTPKKFYQQTSFKIFFVIAIIVLIFAIIIKLPIFKKPKQVLYNLCIKTASFFAAVFFFLTFYFLAFYIF